MESNNRSLAAQKQGSFPYEISNLKFMGTLSDSQWAPADLQPERQQSCTPIFHPATANFQPQAIQPTGTDAPRYNEPRSVPRQDQHYLQQQIYDMRAAELQTRHNAEYRMMTLENATRENAWQHADLKEIIKKDVRALQQRIDHMDSTNSEIESNKDYTHGRKISEDMFKHLSDQEVTKVFIELAKEKEAHAARLRKAATAFSNQEDDDIMGNDKSGGKLKAIEYHEAGMTESEAPPLPGDEVVGFACCGTAFGSLEEIKSHFNSAHALATVVVTEFDDLQPTQNSSARREMSRPHPHAIEIKAPESAKAADEEPKKENLKKEEFKEDVPEEEEPKKEASTPEAVKQGPIENTASAKQAWIPYAVRQMPQPPSGIPASSETFSFEHIQDVLEGKEWSDGFYFITKDVKAPKLESRAYWILEEDHEPYLPKQPGEHGAKLTAVLNNSPADSGHFPMAKNYLNCPVFIRAKGESEYRYYGQYSQNRFSDKLDYDHLMDEVPDHVLRYWADQLGAVGRPEWVTRELMVAIFDPPKYQGAVPTDSAVNTPDTLATADNSAGALERCVLQDLENYAWQLKDWEKDARIKAELLDADAIYKSFTYCDMGWQTGLRLHWEYLECIEYSSKFENMMVGFKKTNSKFKANLFGMTAFSQSHATIATIASKLSDPAAAAKANAAAAEKNKRAKAEAAKQAEEQANRRTIFHKLDFDDETRKPVANAWGNDSNVGRTSRPAAKKPAASVTEGKDESKNAFGMGDLAEAARIADQHKQSTGKVLPPHLRGRPGGK
ncbi:Hypothetical predicted protein [Lecanosticta acicola]|uniref:DUF6697 domain-containing protein n=1 Tax=Lecanosticta acicola TaxID=111012 RepID=A0AAI8Z3I3_9PEZI|nr:Hypothetical predicted protein [Lecanosticta acicola]